MSVEFNNLIKRVFAMAPAAENELFWDFKPEIRRMVRYFRCGSQLRWIVDSKVIGQVSQQLGPSSPALRKKLARTCDRSFNELGISES